MGRRRERLVPSNGVECFEVRIVSWFNVNGTRMVSAQVNIEHDGEWPEEIEVLGAVVKAMPMLSDLYVERTEDEV